MSTTAPQWKETETPFGMLFTEVHPWKVSVNELGEEIEHPPMLRSGGRLIWNDCASSFFKLTIHGSCFLKSKVEIMPEITVAIFHMR